MQYSTKRVRFCLERALSKQAPAPSCLAWRGLDPWSLHLDPPRVFFLVTNSDISRHVCFWAGHRRGVSTPSPIGLQKPVQQVV